MRKRHIWIGVAAVAALTTLAVVVLLITPSSAALSVPTSPAPSLPRTAPPSPSESYLIALPVLQPVLGEVPPGLTPRQAADYAHGLIYRQAASIVRDLKRLRAKGAIADFEVRADLHGVVVEGITSGALDSLNRLNTAVAVTPLGDQPPVCATAAAQAFSEQVFGLSSVAARFARSVQTTGAALLATNPSVDVYVQPGNNQTSISGYTAPTMTVDVRILRGGQAIATRSGKSDSKGFYYFYSYWQSCPSAGYDWRLKPGDVVEVTAGGNTVSTVVARLSAWVDPMVNTVAGRTDPSRAVEVRLSDYSGDPCMSTSPSMTVPTDGGGNFAADFSSQADFDSRASASVYARDANGNSTYATFYAYRVASRFGSDSIWGYINPDVAFTATLKRGSSVVSVINGQSSALGYYSGSFTDTIQAGDVIVVSGGGTSMQYTATSFDVTLDPVANQAAGTTGAGRTVGGWFYKRDSGWIVQTTCSWASDCQSAVANASGAFALPTTLNLVRGDYASFSVVDAAGNFQYADQRPVPVIVAEFPWGGISGYWGDPGAGSVDVIHERSDGSGHTAWDVDVDSWDGEFDTWSGNIGPGDVIQVTDGAVTETMTVHTTTARLDGDTGHLAGSAYNGHLLVKMWDFQRDVGWWRLNCVEANVTGGTYDLTFGGAQVGAQDDADVWSSGPDGHYTYLYPNAFAVSVLKEDDEVWGYSETPRARVTITLKNSVTTKAIYTGTTYGDGYFNARLSNGVPVIIAEGDTLQVQTGDGDDATLTIPELTANVDVANNRVYGRSPASEPVEAQIRRTYSRGWWGRSDNTTADGSGDYYSDSFDGLYWSRDCSPVDTAHPCAQAAATYYNAADHEIEVEGPEPAPVGPDIYESDNTSGTASAYTAIQAHTFHVYSDTDWVSFTVPAMDVTKPASYVLETKGLGWGMDTYLYLYDVDGSTLLAEDDDGGEDLASRIEWTPPATGTYYIKVEPLDSDNTGYCDAIYDLEIMPVRAKVYLPLVVRDY